MGKRSAAKSMKSVIKVNAKPKAKPKARTKSESLGYTIMQKNMSVAASAAGKAGGVKKKPAGRTADHSLAAQLERAAYHQDGMIEMNKCWEICEKIKATRATFAQSREVLFIMNPMAASTIGTQAFKKLIEPDEIRILRFHPYKDGTFDFRGLSKVIKDYVPKLKIISCWSLTAKNFELIDLECVQELTFMGCDFKDAMFDLQLPKLKELVFQNTVPNPKALSKSLLRCPRIERFFAHKLWTVDIPALYLPSCKDFTFRRGDCVRKLHLYLPKVKHVNLDANYDLSDIKFLTQGKPEIKEFCPKPGEPESHFNVSVVNAFSGLDRGPQYLLSHPRVKRIVGLQDSDDDFF